MIFFTLRAHYKYRGVFDINHKLRTKALSNSEFSFTMVMYLFQKFIYDLFRV